MHGHSRPLDEEEVDAHPAESGSESDAGWNGACDVKRHHDDDGGGA
jgi:hypothetical protein